MTKPKTLEQLRAEKERAETRLAQEQHTLIAALPCSLIPTPPDDELSPGIFHLQEDFE